MGEAYARQVRRLYEGDRRVGDPGELLQWHSASHGQSTEAEI
jgi:hypothetical protein